MADWFDFKGIRSSSLGVFVEKYPDVTLAEERAKFEPVPGRSGSLTLLEDDAVYDDIVLSADCFVRDLSALDQIAAWLRGSGNLVLGNRPDRYYKARCVNQIEMAQVLRGRQHRRFPAVFRCSPYRYLHPTPAPLTLRPMNNIVTNGDFSNGITGWSMLLAGGSVTGGVATFTATATNGNFRQIMATPLVAGHKYYARARISATSSQVRFLVTTSAGALIDTTSFKYHGGSGTYENLSFAFTAAAAASSWHVKCDDRRASGWNAISWKYATVIDLTAMFGAGAELTAAQMDSIFASYPGGWPAGNAAYPNIITNPGTADAYPLITIVGSGNVTLTIGGKTLTVTGLASQITFDTETGYSLDGSGNDLTPTASLSKWPLALPPGISNVSMTGTVTSAAITRPWRYI